MRWALPVLLVAACSAAPRQANDVTAVLDDFHDAAAKADEARYFAHFAPEGVFLGTDATERWTVEAFREYAEPHFSAGRGWTYNAVARHVMLSADGRFAWFDEKLKNEKYGLTRGTGVLRLTDEGWKIAHYSLTFLVPNDAAQAVVAVIKKPAGD